jgi:hypothetical protein
MKDWPIAESWMLTDFHIIVYWMWIDNESHPWCQPNLTHTILPLYMRVISMVWNYQIPRVTFHYSEYSCLDQTKICRRPEKILLHIQNGEYLVQKGIIWEPGRLAARLLADDPDQSATESANDETRVDPDIKPRHFGDVMLTGKLLSHNPFQPNLDFNRAPGGSWWVTKTLCTQNEANAFSLWNNNLGYQGI